VYAATLATLGSLRVRAEHVGPETTFGKVIHLVEQAEAHRADVQRLADRFSAYYLPVVAGVALLTLLLRRDPIAAAAVLVVACSCAFALATPIAMLASIGAAAQHGLLIKGGKYLESLAQADTLLIDKTGTLTLGKPEIVAMHWLDPNRASEGLRLAASAERYSEHPLAEAVRQAASREKLILYEPQDFQALPGRGVRALVDGRQVQVGRESIFAGTSADLPSALSQQITAWLGEGRTLLYVWLDGKLAGVLAAGDTLRPETTQALEQVRRLGFAHLELLTGDNPRSAAELAGRLGIAFRADLLPQDKIEIVRQYQASGHRVVMVGDGVNDAPALAQAEVGIAMGAAGSDLAIEAAHIAVLRDDWRGVPQVIQIARRTMRVVKGNLGFTIAYNFLGLSLAAFGILPPIYAAAAQSLPDIGILLNSARLLKQ
jgi:Cd2+/Zn2+-exporting ATPase/Cu+-exporting ATPase